MELTSSRHDTCKLHEAFGRNKWGAQDMGKALFFAIKRGDWQHAFLLLENGAPVCRTYEVAKDEYISTTSLLIQKLALARKQKGHRVLEYKLPDRALDIFIERKADLRCHCSPKFRHRCPLLVALETIGIRDESEIFQERNVLIRKLILNGATLKKSPQDKRTYYIPWFDVEQVRAYLGTHAITEGDDKARRGAWSPVRPQTAGVQKQQQQQQRPASALAQQRPAQAGAQQARQGTFGTAAARPGDFSIGARGKHVRVATAVPGARPGTAYRGAQRNVAGKSSDDSAI